MDGPLNTTSGCGGVFTIAFKYLNLLNEMKQDIVTEIGLIDLKGGILTMIFTLNRKNS